jgi:hypothetical protein
MEQKMVRISVRVRNGAASFRVGIRARSIDEALTLAGRSYPRGDEVGVVFPAELRGYLDGKPAAGATERTLAMAA